MFCELPWADIRDTDVSVPAAPAAEGVFTLLGVASLTRASDNERFANMRPVPVFSPVGGRGTRVTFSKNGLWPELLDKDTPLLLPRSSICIFF